MNVYLNDAWVAEAEASVSVFDRGFLYGDGCFETLRIADNKPLFWREHLNRLNTSLQALAIPYRADPHRGAEIARHLIQQSPKTDAVLRIQVTRGRGKRGYSAAGAVQPTVMASLHPTPTGATEQGTAWRLARSDMTQPRQWLLNHHKTSNKLLQILGKTEAEAKGVDDVVFLNEDGVVTETTSGNLFWLDGDHLVTPPLKTGILSGITRKIILDLCDTLSLPIKEHSVTWNEFIRTDVVFLTQSVWGIVAVSMIGDKALKTHHWVEDLKGAYQTSCDQAPFP